MRVAIIRRATKASYSMDVYADGLVAGLKQVRPNWSIQEVTPSFTEYQGSTASRAIKYYQRYWAFSRQIRQTVEADIFHIIDHSDGHLVYGLRKTGKPVVVTCHDLINYIQPENLSNQSKITSISQWIWNYAVRGICQADHIVTVSDNTAKDVINIFGLDPAQLTTAHNGVSSLYQPVSSAQRDRTRAQHEIEPGTFCLLNVGSNHPRKNVFAVLKALAQLSKQGAPVHLIKAGADFTPEQKNFINSQNLADQVTYVQKPDNRDLMHLYGASDALVAPSTYEGFGITLLEAMACHTPVITSNVTSLPEVVGDAGIMVDPKDTGAIAQAVLKLIEDPDYRRNLIQQGAQRVKAFTWKNAAATTAHIYEEVIIAKARSASPSSANKQKNQQPNILHK